MARRVASVLPTLPWAGGDSPYRDLIALAALSCASPFAVLHIVDEAPETYASGSVDVELLSLSHTWPGMSGAFVSGVTAMSGDALGDHRFAGHEMVAGAPGIRSFVVVPLLAGGGQILGALGVFDTVERSSPPPVDGLLRVARSVVGQVELRQRLAALTLDGNGQVGAPVGPSLALTVAAEAKLRASEQRFRAVYDNSPVAMGIADEAGRWVDTNAALERMLGVGPGELIGAVGRDFVHPDDRSLLDAARYRSPASDGDLEGLEVRFLRRDGELRWAWISLTAAPGLGGERWVLGISKDVTDRKAAETALMESKADLAAVAAVAKCVQSGGEPRQLVVDSIQALSGASTVVLTEALDDHTLVVTACAGRDVVGVQVPLQERSMTAEVWRTGERVFLDDVTASSTVNRALLKTNTAVSSLWQPVVVRGRVEAVIGVGWAHRIDDPGDRAIRVVRIMADEAAASLQASRLHRDLEQSATTDPLTGSLNRRAWDGKLQRLMELAQLSGAPLAVAVLDLDHFKAYNDRYGHMAGDSRLAELAVAARACLRQDDVFARWGGEEFVIALPDCPQEQAQVILERVRAEIPAGLTCSIGHTTWRVGEELTTCIARADSALYIAKNGGRNQLIGA